MELAGTLQTVSAPPPDVRRCSKTAVGDGNAPQDNRQAAGHSQPNVPAVSRA
jgi:hypothetical protein